MQVSSCFFDSPLLREIANFCFSWLFLSGFMLFLPFFFYFGTIFGIMELSLYTIRVISGSDVSKKEIIDIESTLDLNDSITRLSSMLSKNTPALVGNVTSKTIALAKKTSLIRNTFFPLFQGKVLEKDGMTHLIGRWTFPLHVKLFTLFFIWFIVFTAFVQFKSGNFSFSTIVFYIVSLPVGWMIWRMMQKSTSQEKHWMIREITDMLNTNV